MARLVCSPVFSLIRGVGVEALRGCGAVRAGWASIITRCYPGNARVDVRGEVDQKPTALLCICYGAFILSFWVLGCFCKALALVGFGIVLSGFPQPRASPSLQRIGIPGCERWVQLRRIALHAAKVPPLGQDIFLLSQPGPYARRLVMTFCRWVKTHCAILCAD